MNTLIAISLPFMHPDQETRKMKARIELTGLTIDDLRYFPAEMTQQFHPITSAVTNWVDRVFQRLESHPAPVGYMADMYRRNIEDMLFDYYGLGLEEFPEVDTDQLFLSGVKTNLAVHNMVEELFGAEQAKAMRNWQE